MKHLEEVSFRQKVASLPHAVFHRSYYGNSKSVGFLGDADPVHKEPEAFDAIVESAPTRQTKTLWGDDERVSRLVYLLTTDAELLNVSTRDLVLIDGAEFQVFEVLTPENIGHETFTTVLRLAANDQ